MSRFVFFRGLEIQGMSDSSLGVFYDAFYGNWLDILA